MFGRALNAPLNATVLNLFKKLEKSYPEIWKFLQRKIPQVLRIKIWILQIFMVLFEKLFLNIVK